MNILYYSKQIFPYWTQNIPTRKRNFLQLYESVNQNRDIHHLLYCNVSTSYFRYIVQTHSNIYIYVTSIYVL